MLLRHSLYYLFARGLPGLVAFAALVLYTRLLEAEEFGRYASILAAVGLVHVAVFQWLQLVLARFLPAHRDRPQLVQQPVLALFLALAGLVGGLGLVLALLWPDRVWRTLIALSVLISIAQAWLQLNLSLASAQLAPARYARLLGCKSILALLIGGWLAWLGLGARAPLIGLLAGSVFASMLFGLGAWCSARPRWPTAATLCNYSAYGLPLMLTFALGWVIASSDRLLIAWLLDEAATGLYAVGYDLAQHSLGLVLVIVNTAAFPLVIRRFEGEGAQAASAQLVQNGQLIVTLALVGAAGLTALAPAIVEVCVGEEYRSGALAVIPWIAAAAAVAGIKAFHLDIAFQLAQRTRWQAYTSVLAAAANVVLNLMLIPRYGILGAAWATLAAFVLAALVSGCLGRHAFPMPAFLPLCFRGLPVAGMAYTGAWLVTKTGQGRVATLVIGCTTGCAMALLGVLLLNVAGIRKSISVRVKWFWKRIPASSAISISAPQRRDK